MITTRYKYVHLFTVNSAIYNKSIQKLICETQNPSEHLFIYLNKDSFSLAKDLNLGNTLLEISTCSIELLRKVLKMGDIVFIHNMSFPNREIVKLTDTEAKRLIWCVWGSDLYSNIATIEKKSLFYRFLRFVYHLLHYKHIYTTKIIENQYSLAKAKINNFFAICAGFEGDIAEIKKQFPDVNVYQALYPGEFFLDDITSWQKKLNQQDSHQDKVKILLGHCAFPHLQHEKWLKKLSIIKDSVEIHIPLNYGNKKYAHKIEKIAKNIFGQSAICYKEKLTLEEYFIQILSKIDMAIFDFEIQSAYGNALLLLYLGKKIYYPEKSVMYRGLVENGATVFKIESLDLTNIQNLHNNNMNNNIEFAKERLDKKTYIKQWNYLFESLKNRKIYE